MKIRHAETADIQEIGQIYESARAFMRANGNGTQWNSSYPSEIDIRDDIEKEQLFVCEEDGVLLCVFVLMRGADPNYARIEDGAWLNDEPYMTIHRIASAEAARGKGAASYCFSWAEAQSPNLRIDTHADNIPMQNLIKKCGFQRTGIVYMEDGTPRIAFQKTAEAEASGKLS